jgi:hypothetical protein
LQRQAADKTELLRFAVAKGLNFGGNPDDFNHWGERPS